MYKNIKKSWHFFNTVIYCTGILNWYIGIGSDKMNKKEEVINAARDLFTKYGYKKVSMDEIAKEANVSRKTSY